MDSTELLDGVAWTALMIAAQRASESRRPDALVHDPLAEFLVDLVGDGTGSDGPGIWAARDGAPTELSRALEGYVGLRTRYFDDYLAEAAAAGVTQIVVLGSGLDGRGRRLRLPGDPVVFEVDTPDVHAAKGRVVRASGLPATTTVRPVAADLRGDWPAALRAAGHRADAPSAWLAEGLLFYLSAEANDTLLQRVTDLSAPGSRLATEYPDPATPAQVIFGGIPGDDVVRKVSAMMTAGPSAAPPQWLAGFGWDAEAVTVSQHAAALGRPPAPALDAPGGPTWWFATARR